jgi:hypothetical protein
MQFSQAATLVYNNFGCVLFALEIFINKKHRIILNPSQLKLTDIKLNKIKGFIICLDKKLADKISDLSCLPNGLEISMNKSCWMGSEKIMAQNLRYSPQSNSF